MPATFPGWSVVLDKTHLKTGLVIDFPSSAPLTFCFEVIVIAAFNSASLSAG